MSSGIGSHTKAVRGITDDWITPREIIDELGPFDLDPCGSLTQPWPCATRSYTVKDNGLALPWAGRVWLNPPYGSETAAWLHRLAEHGRGTALVFARTETTMFDASVWRRASALLFLVGRLYFHTPDGRRASGNSGGPSVLIAYGDEDAERLRRSRLGGIYVGAWERRGAAGATHDH